MPAFSRIILGFVALTATALLASDPSPYAGLESRDIKALSDESITGYLEGRGMGLALAAELNSYPGPKHVLELADRLGLDDEQAERTRAIFDRMHTRAVELGGRIIEGERELDALFASAAATDASLQSALEQLGRLQSRLRYTHLRAHLEMRALLSSDQITRYDRLRGYGAADSDCPHGSDPSQHGHDGGSAIP